MGHGFDVFLVLKTQLTKTNYIIEGLSKKVLITIYFKHFFCIPSCYSVTVSKTISIAVSFGILFEGVNKQRKDLSVLFPKLFIAFLK